MTHVIGIAGATIIVLPILLVVDTVGAAVIGWT